MKLDDLIVDAEGPGGSVALTQFLATGGRRGREPELYRLKKVADWLHCSVLDLVDRDDALVEATVNLMHAEAVGLRERKKRERV